MRAGLERFNSLEEVAQHQAQLRQEISDRIRLPGPRASAEDMSKFRKAMGVPETADGYGAISIPEGVDVTDQDIAIMEMMAPVCHEANVPLSAFEKIVGEFLQAGRAQKEALETAAQGYRQEQETALRKEWGTEADRNFALASRASETLGGNFVELLRMTGSELAELLGDGMLGDYPVMVKAMSNVGARTDEDTLFIGSSDQERQSAQEELAELNAKVPPHTPAYKDPKHQARVSALYDKIYGSKPIVGSSGRTV